MASKRTYQISIFVISCILINYLGKLFAVSYNLPIWLDSMGTTACAYGLGPVCGAIVGLTNNIIFGFGDPVSYAYSLVSIVIGITVGICAKRGMFSDLFQTLSLSVIVTLLSVIISTALNIAFYKGSTGNMWGDGVSAYLIEHGNPWLFSCLFGEFYVDFADKLITLMLFFMLLKIYRKAKNQNVNPSNFSSVIVCILIAGFIATIFAGDMVYADTTDEEENYNSYVQTVYSSNNGLPCGEANDIAQTGNGVLWIGTYAGLYRYNGIEFKHMSDYESVKNVNCLYVDEEGRLWIGTNDNGLCIDINENIVNVVDTTSGLSADSVRCISQSSDGYYYVGTTDCMQVISLNGGLRIVKDIEEIDYAVSVSCDENGNVAAVDANGGLYIINNQSIVDNNKDGIYVCCLFGEDGRLYCGTLENEVHEFCLTDNRLELTAIYKCEGLNNINSLDFLESGDMMVSSDSGIGFFNKKMEYSPIVTNTFNNSIDNMTVDYQGNLWFTSSRMGVLKLCKSDFLDLYGEAGIERNVVNTVSKYGDELYVGTDKGLDIINLTTNTQIINELTRSLDGVRIRCILLDSNNHIWICTYGQGLWEVYGGKIVKYNSDNDMFGDRARVVIELKNGTIVSTSERGVTYFKDGKIVEDYKYSDGLTNNVLVLSLMEMNDGSVLAGTDGDGMIILKDGEIVRKINKKDGLSSGVILRTVNDIMGDGIYIVTSNGLGYMNADGQVLQLKNFPYSNNYDVWLNEEGSVFVTGSAGIYTVDREELLSGRTLHYDLLDSWKGLVSELTANSWDYCDEEGNMYLSCGSGVFVINTWDYGMEHKSYRMTATGANIDGKFNEMTHGEALEISRETKKIEIFPEVINYSLENPYISYYLEGFDANPNVVLQSDLTSVIYTNLPSGKYTFHIAVLDDKKGNVIEESTYVIKKEKEIQDNKWFVAYMVIILILAVSWFTWFVVRVKIQRTIMVQRRELEFTKNQIEMSNQTILTIAKTVDAKDENTSHHSQRVSEYSVMIAKEYGMNDEQCETLHKVALLHDIGKIGVPDRILNKPARLDDDEYEIMKSHVLKGAEVLKDFNIIENVWEGALYHHERYDGKGYASGLKGEEIPINARIIGIADAFDAMTANRVYRKKLDFDFVLKEIKNGRGTQFDPQFVDILLKLIDEGKVDVERIYNETEQGKA